MGKLLPEMSDEYAYIDMSIEEIDGLFKRYGVMRVNGSAEGLGKIAENIGIGFGDFISRIGANVSSIVKGYFKDLKRSSLQVLVDSNKLAMMRVMSADYATLANVPCKYYPFSVHPREIGMYTRDTFKLFNMRTRLESLIKNYMHLGAAIKIHDTDLTTTIMSKITDLNMKNKFNVKSVLGKMVAYADNENTTTFGTIFDTVSSYKEAVELALTCSSELDEAIKVAKMLEELYKAFEQVKTSLEVTSSKSFDFSKLVGIAPLVHDTGSLIEDYALLVQQYHHYEYFLTGLSENLMAEMKK